MIHPTLLPVYEWNDLELEICTRMGITEEEFHDYGMVIGGSYKNLWHIAVNFIFPKFANGSMNGSIVTLYAFEDNSDIEDAIASAGEWTRNFITAYDSVMKEIDPDYKGVWVSFSW